MNCLYDTPTIRSKRREGKEMKKAVWSLIAIMLSSLMVTAQAESLKKAYFAGGCFWGVEYHLEKIAGVKSVVSGFMGGHMKNPSYQDVSYTNTGHVETVEVTYDADKVSYETLAKNFFEIHDFTQTNGQGPDLGSQYLSVIFYSNDDERNIAYRLINVLQKKGYKVATKVEKASIFYAAEAYHQDYYQRHGKVPYCHRYRKIF